MEGQICSTGGAIKGTGGECPHYFKRYPEEIRNYKTSHKVTQSPKRRYQDISSMCGLVALRLQFGTNANDVSI